MGLIRDGLLVLVEPERVTNRVIRLQITLVI